ncbi:MAG: HEAT repeat domain-containing protein [Chloroflexi bacterium]|nr:HEAT repeat domain-containing protein [Chloroflexota bacterium]
MNSKITVWLSRLTDANPATRREAIHTIEAFGDPAALSALADVFVQDPDPALRSEAQKSAQKIYYNLHRLQIAYQYVKSGANEEARPILEDILKFDHDNIDAWWLSVFVAETPQRKRTALGRVLQLKPDHAPAQVMAQSLDAQAKKMTGPLPERHIIPPKKKHRIRWAYVLLSAFGTVAMMFTSLLILDNFTGGEIFDDFERRVLGEPKPLGYINVLMGGPASEDTPEQDRLPITKRRIIDYGGAQLGVLKRKEAHEFRFSAHRGDEIVAVVNFPSNGDPNVFAMELWNSGGMVAHEVTGMGFTAGPLTGRALQYTVLRDDGFSIVLYSQPGGPAGNYTLMVTTIDKLLSEQ